MKYLKLTHAEEYQRGLSLIELMIALALGVVLTLGVVQVFLGSSQTYRVTDGVARLQENMRYALGKFQYEGRMAGHFGCLVGGPDIQLDKTDAAYDPNVYENIAVMGWEAGGTDLGSTFTITALQASGTAWSNGPGDALPTAIAGSIIPGTDVLMINGSERLNITLSNPNSGPANTLVTSDNTDIPPGRVLLAVQGNCEGGDLFQKTNSANSASLTKGGGTNVSPGNKSPVAGGFDNDYEDDATVYGYASTAYYVGVGSSGGPSLFRERLDGGDTSGAVELVDGIENMQVLYGVASGVEPRADSYVSAANVTNWDNVVSVRVALLMRTENEVQDSAAARTFNLIGTQVTTQSDRRARLVGLSTVSIRNRLK